MGGFLDMACAPQVVVERMLELRLVQAKQDMNSGRLDVGIDDTHSPSVSSQQSSKISGDVGLTRSPSIRMNRNDLRHEFVFDSLKGNAMYQDAPMTPEDQTVNLYHANKRTMFAEHAAARADGDSDTTKIR